MSHPSHDNCGQSDACYQRGYGDGFREAWEEPTEAEVQRLRKGIEAIADAPDGTAWVEVEPYMDPPNEDECVEVRFVDVDRLRALLRDGEA